MRVAAPKPKHTLHRMPQAVAQLDSVKRRDQPPQLCRIEARLDLDTKTRNEHNPKLPTRLHAPRSLQAWPRRNLVNDLDRNNLLPRFRYALAPRIQRMHAQPMRHAKFLAPQSTLLVL
jgi:hypothetical protein